MPVQPGNAPWEKGLAIVPSPTTNPREMGLSGMAVSDPFEGLVLGVYQLAPPIEAFPTSLRDDSLLEVRIGGLM